MNDSALHVLNVACLREGLPVDGGWEHYLTVMGDDGASRFLYDHANGSHLRVTVTGEGYVVEVTPDLRVPNCAPEEPR